VTFGVFLPQVLAVLFFIGCLAVKIFGSMSTFNFIIMAIGSVIFFIWGWEIIYFVLGILILSILIRACF